MGKIKKWLADLGTAAFCSVVNNLTTTAEGGVLDARQGKNLSDALTKLNTLMGSTDISSIGGGTLTGAISELNSNRTISITIKESTNAIDIIKNNWDSLPENIPLDLYLRTSTANCNAHGYRYGKYGMFEILSIERSMCGWLHRYRDNYTFYANSMIK